MLLYISILLNAIVFLLPLLEKEIVQFPTAFLIVLPIAISGLLWKILASGGKTVWSESVGIGRFILDIHGLAFLGIIQTLVLLQIADSVLGLVVQESNYSSLVSMIILAGIFTLAGGLEIVLYASLFVGCISAAGIILALIFPAFVNSSLVGMLIGIFSATGTSVVPLTTSTDASITSTVIGFVVVIISMGVMIFGTFSTMSKVYVNVSTKSRKVTLSAVIIGLIGIVIVMILYISIFALRGPVSVVPEDVVRTFFAVCSIIVLTGILVITFHQFGTLASARISRMNGKTGNDEEQLLFQKLSTLAVVLLAVLMISFVKAAQHTVVAYFVEFIVFFSTPIAVSFILFSLLKKDSVAGISIALLLGETVGAVEFSFRRTLIFSPDNLYAYGLDISVITSLVCVLSAVAVRAQILRKQFHVDHVIKAQKNIKQQAINQLNH
ncbi:MAG: hypothetical protein WCW35_08285 [Bacteroidota bacterium]